MNLHSHETMHHTRVVKSQNSRPLSKRSSALHPIRVTFRVILLLRDSLDPSLPPSKLAPASSSLTAGSRPVNLVMAMATRYITKPTLRVFYDTSHKIMSK